MLDLHKLTIFATVVRAGSFSGAAEELLMTQPAVSQHMQELEASLGARLFQRGRRGVSLTPAGAKLAEYTQAIFRLVAEAENAVTDVANLRSGQIAVGATPGVSVYLLPDPVQEFQSRYPNLAVQVQTGITPHIIEALLRSRLDLGLIEGELDDTVHPAVGVQLLQVVEQLLVVGRRHPWWGLPAVEMQALHGQTFVMRQRSSQTRIWLDGVLQRAQVRPKIGAEFDNVESIKRAVANGTGVTVLPAYAVRVERELGALWTLSVADGTLQRTLKLVWNRETHFSPVVRAFLAHLQRSFPAIDVGAIWAM